MAKKDFNFNFFQFHLWVALIAYMFALNFTKFNLCFKKQINFIIINHFQYCYFIFIQILIFNDFFVFIFKKNFKIKRFKM